MYVCITYMYILYISLMFLSHPSHYAIMPFSRQQGQQVLRHHFAEVFELDEGRGAVQDMSWTNQRVHGLERWKKTTGDAGSYAVFTCWMSRKSKSSKIQDWSTMIYICTNPFPFNRGLANPLGVSLHSTKSTKQCKSMPLSIYKSTTPWFSSSHFYPALLWHHGLSFWRL